MKNYKKNPFRVNNSDLSLGITRLLRDLLREKAQLICYGVSRPNMRHSNLIQSSWRVDPNSVFVTYQYLCVGQVESIMTIKFFSQNYAKEAAIKDEIGLTPLSRILNAQ